jgi:hypothetical protein
MLIRISGKLANGTPFTYRVDADSAIAAVADFGKQTDGKGVVSEIKAAPMGVANDVYFGTAKTPEQIATAKAARAAKKAAKSSQNGATAPAATVPATAPVPNRATVRAGK